MSALPTLPWPGEPEWDAFAEWYVSALPGLIPHFKRWGSELRLPDDNWWDHGLTAFGSATALAFSLRDQPRDVRETMLALHTPPPPNGYVANGWIDAAWMLEQYRDIGRPRPWKVAS